MQSINTVIKFFWFVSILAFLFILFYGYYLLPGTICIKFSSNGSAMDYLERKYLFYLFVVIFAVFNILVLAIEKYFLLLPDNLKPILNKKFWIQSDDSKEILHYLLSNWFYLFMSVLNLCILLSFVVIWYVNYNIQSSILQFTWVPWAIAGAIGACLLYLPIRLSINKL